MKYSIITIYILFQFLIGPIQLLSQSDTTRSEFSCFLDSYRKVSNDFMIKRTLLIATLTRNPRFTNDVELSFLILNASETVAVNNVFHLQLDNFDDDLNEYRKIISNIPNQNTNYCCWVSISVVYERLKYLILETLYSDILKFLTVNSPATLIEFKEALLKLKDKVEYFDVYFVQDKN